MAANGLALSPPRNVTFVALALPMFLTVRLSVAVQVVVLMTCHCSRSEAAKSKPVKRSAPRKAAAKRKSA